MKTLSIILILILLMGSIFSAVEYFANKYFKKQDLPNDLKSSSQRTSFRSESVTNYTN